MTRYIQHPVTHELIACEDERKNVAIILRNLGHAQLADEVTAYRATMADHQALRLTVFGEYSVGKSTLINALLGKQLLAAKLHPTTGVPAEVREGTDTVKIVFRDGRHEEMPLKEADTYSNLGIDHRARDEVERIVISTDSKLLASGIALIDTPGVLDDEKQTERARHEVAAADVVLLVLRADHLLSQTERHFAIDWLTNDLGKPVVPVVNWMSQTEASDHKELRDMLDRFSKGLNIPFGKPWYEVDALPALRYRLRIDGATIPTDDYLTLCGTLQELSPSRIDDLKKQSRDCWRASWTRRARSSNSTVLMEMEKESLRVANKRKVELASIGATLNRILQNVNGERVRCVGQMDQYKTGQRLAVASVLPLDENLETEEQRKNAIDSMSREFERALENIDQNANEVLMRLGADANVMLEPISVRELAALEIPPDTDIAAAQGEAGFKWAIILGGAAAYLIAPWAAIPATVFGFRFGAKRSDTSKQIAEFKKKFCEGTDAELDKLRSLLTDQFNARVEELCEILKARMKAIGTLPPPAQELTLRRKLDALLEAEG